MRNISIIIVLLYTFAEALSAQNTDALDTLYSKMTSSEVTMEYAYTLTSGSGVRTIGDGCVSVQGNAYVMKGNGLELYCDGKTVWVIDPEGKEVVIETPAQGEEAYMDNPALLFVNMDKAFLIDGSKRNGSTVSYVLSSKVESGIRTAAVTLEDSGEAPVIKSAVFSLADGSSLDIKIKSMTFSEKKPLTSFFYDISRLDSSWLVTDLR